MLLHCLRHCIECTGNKRWTKTCAMPKKTNDEEDASKKNKKQTNKKLRRFDHEQRTLLGGVRNAMSIIEGCSIIIIL